MRTLLTAAAALGTAVTLPAATGAQQAPLGFVAPEISNGVRIVRNGRGDDHRRDRWDRRDRHRYDRGVYVANTYGGEWALYNNRSWESGSYNDWWHDRTDRSYPRWIANNAECQRMWWSGSGWRC